MAIFHPLERLEKKYDIISENNQYSGNSARLYEVEHGVLAKIPIDKITKQLTSKDFYQKELFKEYSMQKLMVDLGLKFPKTFGQYAILDKTSGRYFPSFLIEKYNGIKKRNVPSNVQKTIDSLFNTEMEKAMDYGILIGDRNSDNLLWLPDKEDIIMLDAGACSMRTLI